MSVGEAAPPGAPRRVAVAATHGEPPEIVLATDGWMSATGEVLDGCPDEPVGSDRQLDEERASMEWRRLAPIFGD